MTRPDSQTGGAADSSAVGAVEAAEAALTGRGRELLGVTGEDSTEPLRVLLRRYHVGLYPVIALGLLAFVDGFQSLVIGTLGPEISRSMGISAGTLAFVNVAKGAALAVGAVWMAGLAGRRPARAALSVVTGVAWSVLTLLTGLVRNVAGLGATAVADGVSSGSVAALHTPLMLDSYPPAVRVRVTTIRTAMLMAAGVVAPLMVTLLVGVMHFTWRGALVILAVPSILVSLFALGLRDPGFGAWDSDRVREMVQQETHAEPAPLCEDVPLGFFEASRRIWLIPSMRKAIVASIVAAMGAPASTYYTFWLQDRWGLGPSARGILGSASAAVGVLLTLLAGPIGDRLFGRDPRAVIRFIVRIQIVTVAMSVLSLLSPWFLVMAALAAVSQTLPSAISPVLSTTIMNVIPGRLRAAFIAVLSIASTVVGGTFGVFFLAGLDKRVGLTWALLLMNIPVVIGIVIMSGIRHDIAGDLDATVESIIEQEELAALSRSGVRPPLLACRKIDFSYGPVQVLFDVDLTIDDGEMVALLGTNGAGKSTLLGVISGLNLPSAGSVRLRGSDITYVDPERRVAMGLSQIIGGKATFGPLSVAENLRVFGYSHGRSRRTIERGIEDSFAAFPQLAKRRNQLAQTLSGGEQQMLGLAQALILQPTLLCIDELSLGLAPKIVGELLAMVRQINARGTAIVLVEQSASIALTLVDHAYFMERGQIRFDGRAADLLHRDDLLRSVFLQGADRAIASNTVEPS